MSKSQPRVHATTRYQQVTEEVIDELQTTYLTGRDLYRAAPWISYANRQIIVAETLEADRILTLSARQLSAAELDLSPVTDFKAAAAAEMMLEVSALAKATPEDSLNLRAWKLLAEVARSPTATPLLAYEHIYRDLAEVALLEGGREALDWLKRALAHNQRFFDGDDVTSGLIDLASAYLQLGDLDVGLTILTQLLQEDPTDIWVYRFLATGSSVLGLTALGLQAARRGLALLDEYEEQDADVEDLRDELMMAQIELQMSPAGGRESSVSPNVLAQIEAALILESGFATPRSTPELCEALVPGWDAVPVKAPLRFEDLPPLVRRRMAAAQASASDS